MNANSTNRRFLPLREVQKIAGGKSNTTLWRWEKKGLFPKRVLIGPNSTAWPSDQIDAWAEDPIGWRKAHGVRLGDDQSFFTHSGSSPPRSNGRQPHNTRKGGEL